MPRPPSDNSARLILGALLVVGVFSLALAQEREDERDGVLEDATWNNTENALERELETADSAENVPFAQLLELYADQQLDEALPDGADHARGSTLIDLPMVRVVGQSLNRLRSNGVRNFPRSMLYECPKAPRRDPNGRRAKVLYYNPDKNRTFNATETREGAWRQSDLAALVANGFDPRKPTLLVTFGWMQHPKSPFIVSFKRLFREMWSSAERRPVNLLIYDWSSYGIDLYESAVAYVPHLGQLLARFFGQLIDKYDYRAGHIQMVSFSLSTHIVGLAGRQLRASHGESVAVIHALDPTGVCFHDSHAGSQFAREHGLRPTDAELVLARHYNMRQLGAGRLIGGLDILVNDGMSQPTMRPEGFTVRKVLAGLGIFLTSHMRAVEHETTRFDANANCHELAYECSSHEAFLAGECGQCRSRNNSCLQIHTLGNLKMGQRLDQMNFKPGLVMHMTTGRRQYCEHHYQVVVRLKGRAPQSTLDAFEQGKFAFKLGDEQVTPSHPIVGRGTNLFTQLLRPWDVLGPHPNKIELDSSAKSLLRFVKSVSVRHMSHMLAQVRRARSAKYCANANANALVKCK